MLFGSVGSDYLKAMAFHNDHLLIDEYLSQHCLKTCGHHRMWNFIGRSLTEIQFHHLCDIAQHKYFFNRCFKRNKNTFILTTQFSWYFSYSVTDSYVLWLSIWVWSTIPTNPTKICSLCIWFVVIHRRDDVTRCQRTSPLLCHSRASVCQQYFPIEATSLLF